MGELDLSKAIEAADSAMEGVGIDDALFQKDRQQASRLAVRAALPHVLEALAAKADADKAAAGERFHIAPTATERVDASQWGDVCELAAVYLRHEAEEARA